MIVQLPVFPNPCPKGKISYIFPCSSTSDSNEWVFISLLQRLKRIFNQMCWIRDTLKTRRARCLEDQCWETLGYTYISKRAMWVPIYIRWHSCTSQLYLTQTYFHHTKLNSIKYLQYKCFLATFNLIFCNTFTVFTTLASSLTNHSPEPPLMMGLWVVHIGIFVKHGSNWSTK